MLQRRLDVQVNAEYHEFIKNEAEKRNIPMNAIADELLAIGIAARKGEIIEQQSLPIIREVIQEELRKQFLIQKRALREDISIEVTNEIKGIQHASDTRLAGLMVRTLRDANIARRLLFTVLAKAHGPDFAQKAYADASEKAGRDIASRPAKGEQSS